MECMALNQIQYDQSGTLSTELLLAALLLCFIEEMIEKGLAVGSSDDARHLNSS